MYGFFSFLCMCVWTEKLENGCKKWLRLGRSAGTFEGGVMWCEALWPPLDKRYRLSPPYDWWWIGLASLRNINHACSLYLFPKLQTCFFANSERATELCLHFQFWWALPIIAFLWWQLCDEDNDCNACSRHLNDITWPPIPIPLFIFLKFSPRFFKFTQIGTKVQYALLGKPQLITISRLPHPPAVNVRNQEDFCRVWFFPP